MLPKIIQGGMGVNISNWLLAKTVSMFGQQGTVSGVAAEKILVRMLQIGDPDGHFRRALAHFPFQNVVEKVLKTFYVEGGVSNGKFKNAPVFSIKPSALLISLLVCANYALVWLAKEDHENPVSINYLEKVAIPHIFSITGAMLANVDFITMGAGIPDKIPGVIDNIWNGKTAEYEIPVISTTGQKANFVMSFNPEKFFGTKLPRMKKPGFIPIIASNVLAGVLMKKIPTPGIYGFVVEESTAGGHNAPPRNKIGYGEKDKVDYRELYKQLAGRNLPFWIGGSYASPEKLKWALSVGASGIQVGSIFALCEESGMDPKIRRKIRRLGFEGKLQVKTDMRFSPTGFPIKVVQLEGTLSEQDVYEKRLRICNQGSLVSLYQKSDGSIGYRCPSEPVDRFVSKGGKLEDTVDRGCLCNGLIKTAGLGNRGESPFVTLGDDVSFLKKLMSNAFSSYGAEDAIKYLLS